MEMQSLSLGRSINYHPAAEGGDNVGLSRKEKELFFGSVGLSLPPSLSLSLSEK